MLISCPECNAKVSDKAHICPHCGFQIDTLVKCPDCGKLVRL
ncbi:MAG: zinc ribbon domain-containing protein, partial [candidate division Zixibacteria bacterium]|nr:zinc ribbon domain-containing protein [candidate division Zixibacteria bacterium]